MRQSNLFIAVMLLASATVLGVFGIAAIGKHDTENANASYSGRVVVPLKRPTVSFGNPSVGPKDAPVTIFSFGDYQCAPCADLNASLAQVASEFPNDVRVVWKDMPDSGLHGLAVPAAVAARCADEQGAFWTYHQLLMEQQSVISEENFAVFAVQAGLDSEAFKACRAAGRGQGLVDRDYQEGQRLQITATPTLFINERRVTGAIGHEQLRGIIMAEIAAAKSALPADAPATN